MEKIRIAIADDHEMVRNGLIGLINDFGDFKVDIQAGNGQELLEQIEKADTFPEICIVDIGMPVMNGYDTVAAIRKKWPFMKILALTMLDDEYCVVKMIANGANGYILKGDNTEKLEEALRTLYKKGAYHTDLISNQVFQAIAAKKINVADFTDRETDLLKYICSDMTYLQIAEEMGVSVRSVEGYRDNLFKKLHVNSRVSLALFSLRLGIVSLH